MLTEIEIRSPGPRAALASAVVALTDVFPDLAARGRRTGVIAAGAIASCGEAVVVPAGVWRDPDFDPSWLDDVVAAVLRQASQFSLRLDHGGADDGLPLTSLQVVTRCQRHLGGGNRHSDGALFAAIVREHRSLHDRSRPLVAADHDHALDTWRWVLRLDPEASLAVQVAALFHDIERLTSESEVRVEQQAADYLAFKNAHAAAGARITAAALAGVGAPRPLVARVAELVASHEHGGGLELEHGMGGDPERQLLNEADALSFFSLNAPGFARYYGPDHTAKKVAYTLARLGPRGRRALAGIRHRADIAALIAAEGTET
jgi:hypothetical protein